MLSWITNKVSSAIAAARRVAVALLIACMSLNLVAGVFSGYVHAHEHNHFGYHHYQHDHSDHDHHGGPDHQGDDHDRTPAEDSDVGIGDVVLDRQAPQDHGDSSGKLHEHGSTVTLAFSEPEALTHDDVPPSWQMGSQPCLITGYYGSSERPPRVA